MFYGKTFLAGREAGEVIVFVSTLLAQTKRMGGGIMDTKMKELIAIGASVTANC